MTTHFTVERALRATAGLFVLLSVIAGYFAHPAFWLLTAFVGANLLQSAFTNWCPAVWFYEKVVGLPRESVGATMGPATS